MQRDAICIAVDKIKKEYGIKRVTGDITSLINPVSLGACRLTRTEKGAVLTTGRLSIVLEPEQFMEFRLIFEHILRFKKIMIAVTLDAYLKDSGVFGVVIPAEILENYVNMLNKPYTIGGCHVI